MGENWTNFFTTAPARQRTAPEPHITLGSTTDTQQQVDDAASGDGYVQQTPSFIYTEMLPAEREIDGGTEHGQAFVMTDLGEPVTDADDSHARAYVPLPPQTQIEKMAAQADWELKQDVARAAWDDYDAVTNQEDFFIPTAAAEIIKHPTTPNGPLILYHLAQHRQECNRLLALADKPGALHRAIVKLSADLVRNPLGASLDKLPYDTYRRVRDQQVRTRR